jgi:mannitol/fructose-specific phosphotransferase system IIA component (Ntr-type)
MSASPGVSLLWSPQLVARIPTAEDAFDAIQQAARPLAELGAVTGEFLPAVVAGEQQHPTGVESTVPFALVGTRALGALRLAAAVGVFKTPVLFSSARHRDRLLEVRIVAVTSLPKPGDHGATLRGLGDSLRDGELAEVLLTIPATEAHALLCEAIDFYVRERAAGVWRLIEIGDNFLKYAKPTERARAMERAGKRYQEALEAARSLRHGELIRLVELRLADLEAGEEDGRASR